MRDLINREDVIKCLQENGWLADTNIDELIETITNTKPILLWDDVFSELDNISSSLLVEKSKNYQNIITTNSLINIDLTNMNGHIYTINNGKVMNERK